MGSLLEEIRASQLSNVPGLLPILFPDNCLPLPPSQILKKLAAHPLPMWKKNRWAIFPDLDRSSVDGNQENRLATWLRLFGLGVAMVCTEAQRPLTRKKKTFWTERSVEGRGRNVDLLYAEDPEHRWPSIQVHGLIRPSDSKKHQETASIQLFEGASLIFSNQDNRRFVISIAFMGDIIRLFVFDRAGLVTTAPFNMHNEPESFVRVMVALMFTDDPAVLGYDTSIIETDNGRFIDVESIRYRIVETLYIESTVFGRGTVCWRARHNGQDFVVKDAWVDTSHPHREAEMLQLAHDVEGVPKLVADIIVQVNGVEERTQNLRSNIAPTTEPGENTLYEACSAMVKKIHRRLVTSHFAKRLPTFATRKELVSIFIDVINAHRDLYLKANILHRDMSVNNIMLLPFPITCDSAGLLLPSLPTCHILEVASAGKPAASGTRAFMAIEVLETANGLLEHEPRHDLESMLYVLIWVCINFAGPRDSERKNFNIYRSPLRPWIIGESHHMIGRAKHSSMKRFFESDVLDTFAPYFEPLKSCASAWRQLWLDDNLTYDAVLSVLQDTLPSLADVESWSEEDDPEGYGVRRKRKRVTKHEVEADGGDDRPWKFCRREDGDRRAGRSEP
ncbi:hypothetical protein C8R47DRAFT_1034461 [Mycena vitilis]|nr:hypothetical protein C8R47DRAFT_1034461 [Mycena vitilis]